jgi:hypothetical protein
MHQTADAISTKYVLTPERIQKQHKGFTITMQKLKNGLVRFNIERDFGDREVYWVANIHLQAGEKSLIKISRPSYVYGGTETWSLDLTPNYARDSQIRLSENSFSGKGDARVAVPGGIDYIIRLKDFYHPVVAK